MTKKSRIDFGRLVEPLLLFLIAALVYLPFAHQFGYYNDDWYSMYATRVAGPGILRDIYSIDRPGRAYLMIPLYILFKGNPFYYSLSAYLLRVLGAFSLLWLLRMLWPKNRNETFLMVLLFLVYPGFLSQPNAIDFQSHLAGIFLAFLSLGLMIKSFGANGAMSRTMFWFCSVLTGWAYLSQMEYYIGFEVVRIALIVLLALRENNLWKKALSVVLRKWLPYSSIPLGYLTWRIFIFHNQRATTDVDYQLGKFFEAPLATLYLWLVNLFQSFLNVLVLAWGVPFSSLSFSLDLHSSLVGLVFAFAVLIAALPVFLRLRLDQLEDPAEYHWQQEALWLGLAWVLAGLLAVIIGNRAVVFPNYSRYGLVSAAGAVVTLVSIFSQWKSRIIRALVLAFLLISVTITHYANGAEYASEASAMRSFWWQVSWRIPQMEQGTTLIVSYPHSAIRESSFVWGPANQVYYSVLSSPMPPIHPRIFALLLNKTTVLNVLTRKKAFLDAYNVVQTYPNYRHILILSQPGPASCVHVIDGQSPEYSSGEASEIMVIGSYSGAQHILLDESLKTPPAFLFGTEPQHGWCFYYERASLARQRGEWDKVYETGEQAFGQGLEPRDLIEWMPFLQAYAIRGDVNRLMELAPKVTADPFIAQQACRILSDTKGISQPTLSVINSLYCLYGSN